MAFGFGKKDKQPAPQQISPEALALLEQMAQNNMAAQTAPGQTVQGHPIQGRPIQGHPVPGEMPASMAPTMAPIQAAAAPVMPAAHEGAEIGHPAPQMGVPAAPLQPAAPSQAAPLQAAPLQTAPLQAAPLQAEAGAQAPQMPAFTAPTMPDGANLGDPTPEKKGWLGKKPKKPAKPKLSRDEKKLAAKTAKEEKIRVKRRKKLSKSRFSRARYLREANGNAVAGLALWVFTILIVVTGLFVLNTQFLLPQTRENNDIINQISQLRDTIERSRPQLEIAIRDKSERENQIKKEAGNFINQPTAQGLLEQFLQDLRDAGIEISEDTPAKIFEESVGVTGLVGQTLHLTANADFLTYLRIRNRFVSAQRSIRVTEERITATPGDPIMVISLKLTIPASAS